MKKMVEKFEEKREKILRNIMRGIAVYTVLCTIIAIISFIIGICGTPVPWIEIIILFIIVTYNNVAVYNYHKEIGLW